MNWRYGAAQSQGTSGSLLAAAAAAPGGGLTNLLLSAGAPAAPASSVLLQAADTQQTQAAAPAPSALSRMLLAASESAPAASEASSLRPPLVPRNETVSLRRPAGLPTASALTMLSRVEPPKDDSPSETDSADADDRDFAREVDSLLQRADFSLLREDFEPFEHVVGVLMSSGGTNNAADIIDEKLAPYLDLQESASDLLHSYVDRHYGHFHKSIECFGKMATDVYDVRETLNVLDNDSSTAATGLESHADQLRQFRVRAIRAAIMQDVLVELERFVRCEPLITALIQQRHYYAAILQLQHFERVLRRPDVRTVRCIGRLSAFTNSTLASLHTDISESLFSCVFRRHRLTDAPQSVARLLIMAGARGRALAARLSTEPVVPPANILQMDDDENVARPERVFVTFIPLCLRSLNLLGRVGDANSIFLEHSAKNIEKFVAKFIAFYVSWQKACVRQSEPHALSSATTRRAADRTGSAVLSLDEAAAKLQAQGVRSLLGVLCDELAKVLRNADYMIGSLAAMAFPYVQQEIMQHAPLRTCALWSGPFESASDVYEAVGDVQVPHRDLLVDIVRKTEELSRRASTADAAAIDALWKGLNIRQFLSKRGVDMDSAAGQSGALPSIGDVLAYMEDMGTWLQGTSRSLQPAAIHAAVLCVLRHVPLALRECTIAGVAAIADAWDVRLLWRQVNHHLTTVVKILCGVSVGGAADLNPGAAKRNRGGGAKKRSKQFVPSVKQTFHSLGTLLSTAASSGLGPRFMEDVGTVSFSLTAASEVVQAESRTATMEAEARALATETGRVRLIEDAASGLGNHLLLSKFNAVVVYSIIDGFVQQVSRQVPSLDPSVCPSSALLYAGELVSGTFAPALKEKHLAKLRSTCLPALPTAGGFGAGAPTQTVFEPTSEFPVVEAVSFVQAVALKVRRLGRFLPPNIADDLQRIAMEPLVEELVLALKRSIQAIGGSSIAYRLVQEPFQEAFLLGASQSEAKRRWVVMRDEANVFATQALNDERLFAFYSAASAQRTSGYDAKAAAKADSAGGSSVGDEMSQLASTDPRFLRLTSSAITSMALVCHSLEWLANTLVSICLIPVLDSASSLAMTNSSTGASLLRVGELSRCLVPGTIFFRLVGSHFHSLSKHSAAASRLVALYQQVITVSQAALFVLAIDARFAAFQFLPQLRDEPFTWAASPSDPDAVITQLNQSLLEHSALLSLNLAHEKRKYVALTIAKPSADLILLELSRLRDKRITDGGQTKLLSNVVSLQNTLQMLVPGDAELSDAVSECLKKVFIYICNIRNRDIVGTLISSGDYMRFSPIEVENLISLVFHGQSSADLVEHVMSYRRRIQALGASGVSVAEYLAGLHQPSGPTTTVAAAAAPALLTSTNEASTDEEDEDEEEEDEEEASEESSYTETATETESETESD